MEPVDARSDVESLFDGALVDVVLVVEGLVDVLVVEGLFDVVLVAEGLVVGSLDVSIILLFFLPPRFSASALLFCVVFT